MDINGRRESEKVHVPGHPKSGKERKAVMSPILSSNFTKKRATLLFKGKVFSMHSSSNFVRGVQCALLNSLSRLHSNPSAPRREEAYLREAKGSFSRLDPFTV